MLVQVSVQALAAQQMSNPNHRMFPLTFGVVGAGVGDGVGDRVGADDGVGAGVGGVGDGVGHSPCWRGHSQVSLLWPDSSVSRPATSDPLH